MTVSTYQACLLMMFNDKQTLSLDELRQATGIIEVELRRHLLSLCTPKLRILCKASKGKVRHPLPPHSAIAEFNLNHDLM